ncbi:MAG: alpha-L-fucosidase [bacterium]|nr:alpha-L-fucosidase [bacterium]
MKRTAIFGRVSRALSLALLAAALLSHGAAYSGEESPGRPVETEEQKEARMAWWRDAKFGLFIHWGPVSLKGTEIGWSRGGERRGTGGTGQIPLDVYDNLYKQFNPVKFNADEWVSIAKSAGMKYLVFTSKHHDGFSMFDTKLTDYKITNSPFTRDVVGELAKACHEGGLRFGFYYSPPDWHHPDYRTENHARYIKFLHGQLRELCSNYGRVDIVWFDGLGGKAEDWDSPTLLKMIRQLQPRVIINNRAGLPADHDTPEQEIGHFQTDRAWESCITIGTQWAWKPDDRIKSLKECIDTLVRCVGGDGNLLFNVGPMPTGEIEPRQVARLKEMGEWLTRYGESIYGVRGGPFRPGLWGASTYKGNNVYVHILTWPQETILLPPIQKKIVASSTLTGGAVNLKQTDAGIEISVAASSRQELDTIVVLELDAPAAELKVGILPSGSVTTGKSAKASNVYQKMKEHGPDKALDDDPNTRWATDSGVHSAWLEVDLGEPVTINRAFISEAYDRVRSFELQYKQEDVWKTFARNGRIGEGLTMKFESATARVVRLNILEAVEGPTIWEFQLFPVKQ